MQGFLGGKGMGLNLKVEGAISQEGGLGSKMPQNRGEGVSKILNFKGISFIYIMTLQ